MTEEELKIKFDHIQGIFNRCINHASQVMIDNIASKSLYFDEEQADKLEQQEYVRTADELVQLYIRYSVLNDINKCAVHVNYNITATMYINAIFTMEVNVYMYIITY